MPADVLTVNVQGGPAAVERIRRAMAGHPIEVQEGTGNGHSVLVITGDASAVPPLQFRPTLLLAPTLGAAELELLRLSHIDVVSEAVSDVELAVRVERLRRFDRAAAYEEIIGQLAEGVVVVDAQRRIVAVNAAGTAMLGWPEQVRGIPLADLVRAIDADGQSKLRQALNGTERLLNVDVEVELHSGRKVRLCVNVGETLRSGYRIASFRDVTAERVTEAELRRTSDFLEHLIESSSDAIIAADLRGRLLVYNSAAERMFGIPAAEAKASVPVTELYPQGGAREVMRLLRDAPTGHIEAVRAYGKSKTGELIPVELSASLLKVNGKEIGSVGLLRDIRERVRVESELARTRARLNDVEKQREITALAGATAHELNQPLTVIFGFVELLIRKAEGTQRAHLQAISEQAERMSEIVKRIAKLTHIKTTPYPGERVIADLERSSQPPLPKRPFSVNE